MTWKCVPTITLRDDQLPPVLVGLPGAGKTIQAEFLAQTLGTQVTNTGAEIHRCTHMTIPEIFAAEGGENFHDREHRTMRAALGSPAAAQGVIALGGGVMLRPENRDLLYGHTAIYLFTSPSTATKHVGGGAGHLIMAPDVGSDRARTVQQRCEEQDEHAGVLVRMGALHARRSPLCSEVVTLTVPADGLSPQQVAALILTALGVQTSQTVGILTPMAEAQIDSPATPDGTEVSPRHVRIRFTATTEGSSGVRRVTVGGQSPYDVLIGRGTLAGLSRTVQGVPGADAGGIVAIHARALSDCTHAAEVVLIVEGLRVPRLEVPDGEAVKKACVTEYLWERLGSSRLGCDGPAVRLGGGTTTDPAGFVTTTWL